MIDEPPAEDARAAGMTYHRSEYTTSGLGSAIWRCAQSLQSRWCGPTEGNIASQRKQLRALCGLTSVLAFGFVMRSPPSVVGQFRGYVNGLCDHNEYLHINFYILSYR
jgi:hypothetical protein